MVITDYQRKLILDFENIFKALREEVVKLEESVSKRNMLYHIDKYIDLYPLSEIHSLQNTLDSLSFLIAGLEDSSNFLKHIEYLQFILDELCYTYQLQGEKLH